jgi:hypothetical protein
MADALNDTVRAQKEFEIMVLTAVFKASFGERDKQVVKQKAQRAMTQFLMRTQSTPLPPMVMPSLAGPKISTAAMDMFKRVVNREMLRTEVQVVLNGAMDTIELASLYKRGMLTPQRMRMYTARYKGEHEDMFRLPPAPDVLWEREFREKEFKFRVEQADRAAKMQKEQMAMAKTQAAATIKAPAAKKPKLNKSKEDPDKADKAEKTQKDKQRKAEKE